MGQKTASFLAVLLVGLIIGSSAYYVLMKEPSTEPSKDCKEDETLIDGNCVPESTVDDESPDTGGNRMRSFRSQRSEWMPPTDAAYVP